MILKNYQIYAGFEYTLVLFPITLLFFFSLTGCPSQVPYNQSDSSQRVQPAAGPHQTEDDFIPGVRQPSWTMTEYVFYNKTSFPIHISGDSSSGGVFLHPEECTYIQRPNWIQFMKITHASPSKQQICGGSECFNKKREALLHNYGDFERDTNSPVPYLESYAIVDSNEVFEALVSPVPSDSSQKSYWTRQCKSLSSPIHVK